MKRFIAVAFMFAISFVLMVGMAQATSVPAAEYCWNVCSGGVCDMYGFPCRCPWGTITCDEYYCYECAR